MTIRELEDEIEKTEKALFASPSLKDWDRLINRYNELKINWYQMTGRPVEVEAVNIVDLNMK